jgi:hypothetical protein
MSRAGHGRTTLTAAEWPDATGAGVRVAVVDSGVAVGHPHVAGVRGGVALVGDDADDIRDRFGHGTAVAAAIRQHAPACELVAVRVFDAGLATTARVLCAAIAWAADQSARLVNLSVGTTNAMHASAFEQAVARARAAGCLVVSAAADHGVVLLPGCMPGVIGVVADDSCARGEVRAERDGERLVLRASPRPRPIDGVPDDRNLSGVSFAVANVTGVLARGLSGGRGAEVLAWLHEVTGGT